MEHRSHRDDRAQEVHSSLCVVCPAYNEEEVVGPFYEALKESLCTLDDLEHQIVFVDDGSSDGTLSALNLIADRDPCVKVYSLSRNFGHQVALSAGLDVAQGAAVVMMDSDLQHPPKLIPEMVRRWREGSDIVSAVRERTEGVSWFKRVTSDGFYWVINSMSDTQIPVGAADFCLLSQRAHHAMLEMPERHRFLRGLVSWMGFSRTFVPFTAPERVAGESKYGARKMFTLALDAMLSFSATPMRVASRFGLALVLLGFTYLGYIVVRWTVLEDLVAGWGSVVSVALILGGAQLAFIGLIGEYMARVFEEVKGRPLYFFKQVAAPDRPVAPPPDEMRVPAASRRVRASLGSS